MIAPAFQMDRITPVTEEALGKAMLAQARKEGQAGRVPKFISRTCYEDAGEWEARKKAREEAQEAHRMAQRTLTLSALLDGPQVRRTIMSKTGVGDTLSRRMLTNLRREGLVTCCKEPLPTGGGARMVWSLTRAGREYLRQKGGAA